MWVHLHVRYITLLLDVLRVRNTVSCRILFHICTMFTEARVTQTRRGYVLILRAHRLWIHVSWERAHRDGRRYFPYGLGGCKPSHPLSVPKWGGDLRCPGCIVPSGFSPPNAGVGATRGPKPKENINFAAAFRSCESRIYPSIVSTFSIPSAPYDGHTSRAEEAQKSAGCSAQAGGYQL